MSYELIISEKPQAAEKIAKALADKAPVKSRNKVNHFTLTRSGKKIVVASAVGHLYGLGEKGESLGNILFLKLNGNQLTKQVRLQDILKTT